MKRKNEPWRGSERDFGLGITEREQREVYGGRENNRPVEMEGIDDNEIVASARERIMKTFSKVLETIDERNHQAEAQELVYLLTICDDALLSSRTGPSRGVQW
jgi:hypothetical protein